MLSVGCYLLLATCYLLIVTCHLLLATCYLSLSDTCNLILWSWLIWSYLFLAKKCFLSLLWCNSLLFSLFSLLFVLPSTICLVSWIPRVPDLCSPAKSYQPLLDQVGVINWHNGWVGVPSWGQFPSLLLNSALVSSLDSLTAEKVVFLILPHHQTTHPTTHH